LRELTGLRIDLAYLHVFAGHVHADSAGVVRKGNLNHPTFGGLAGIAPEKSGRGDLRRKNRAFEWVVESDLRRWARGRGMASAGRLRQSGSPRQENGTCAENPYKQDVGGK
jgi:hypothetical protein